MAIPTSILRGLVHATGYLPSKRLSHSLEAPVATQSKVLEDLLRRNGSAEFGKRFDFRQIHGSKDFQRRVPIHNYSLLAQDIERIKSGEKNVLFPESDVLHMFGLTSGSTGEPKTIPITNRYLKRFRQTYGIWSSRILKDHPGLVEGKYLALYSDWRESFTEKGVPCGAVTGLLASLQPPWIRSQMVVPAGVTSLKNPEIKEEAVLHHALLQETVLWTSANPSTLLRLAKHLETHLDRLLRNLSDGTFEFRKDLPGEYRDHPDFRANQRRSKEIARRIDSADSQGATAIWPNLQVLSCWMGGTLTPYLAELRRHFPGVDMRDPGLMASEGRFTIPIEDNTASGVPDLSSLYFEFYPADGDSTVPVGEAEPLLLSHEIEVGKQYYLIFSCDWGLYRYHIDDIVEVTDCLGDVPLLRFVRKGSGISSLTGEKVSEDQVVRALETLPEPLRSRRNDVVLAPVWGDPPGYFAFLEEGPDLSDDICEEYGKRLEANLRELNCEYDVKRSSERLHEIRIALIPRGTYDRIKQEDVQRAGGRSEQYKLKRIQPDLQYASRFEPYRVVAR